MAQLTWLLGASPHVSCGLGYLSATEVQYASGLAVVAHDTESGRQRFSLPSGAGGAPPAASLSALALSGNKRCASARWAGAAHGA